MLDHQFRKFRPIDKHDPFDGARELDRLLSERRGRDENTSIRPLTG